MRHDDHAIEERLGPLIVEGQRHVLWIRSEPDGDGTWHNVVVFRRDGKLASAGGDARSTGVDWHLPPGFALRRARDLDPKERLELFRRALRPRPPII